ncbi:MAG: PEP-CTERM sorting domain-containing protein [Lentisphaeria bacterium]
MNLTPRTLAAVLAALSLAPAGAAVIETHSYTTDSTNNYNGLISATDLINAGQDSLLSATSTGAFQGNNDATHGLAGTHDGKGQGLVPGDDQANTAFTYNNAVTLTYTLNTTGTNGSATGYTIMAVDVVAGWPSAAKYANQSWSVAVATVANPTVFNKLADVAYYPADGSEGSSGYTHVQLTRDTGALATGISAIQVVLNATTSIISEIDVTGFATPVPEPAALTLLLAGLLGTGLRHRRPAK